MERNEHLNREHAKQQTVPVQKERRDFLRCFFRPEDEGTRSKESDKNAIFSSVTVFIIQNTNFLFTNLNFPPYENSFDAVPVMNRLNKRDKHPVSFDPPLAKFIFYSRKRLP